MKIFLIILVFVLAIFFSWLLPDAMLGEMSEELRERWDKNFKERNAKSKTKKGGK